MIGMGYLCGGGSSRDPATASSLAVLTGSRMPPPPCALRIGKGHVAHHLRRVLEIMGSRGFLLDLEHYLALRLLIPP